MFAKALTFAVLAGVALAQTFSINTPPSIQQCQPAALSWTGGTGPFILAAIPAGQVSAAALATIAGSVTGNSYTWTVNLAQGTAITIRATDSLGNIAYSSPITVQAGSGSGCLSASPSGSGAAAPSVTGSAASSVSSVASAQSSAVATISTVITSSSVSSSVSGTSTSSSVSTTVSTSRAASSTAAASSSAAAAGVKAAFNVPFLAAGAVVGCIALGGFTLLA